MKTSFYLTFGFFVILTIAGCQSAEKAANQDNTKFDYYIENGTKYGDIRLGEFCLHNNVWGKEQEPVWEQVIFSGTLNDETLFGWKWDLPTGNQVNYPEIIFGTDPWIKTETDALPRTIVKNESIYITHNARINSSGIHNLAFDIWIGTEKIPTQSTLTHEVMIFQVIKDLTPLGVCKGSVKIDGVTYLLYVKENCTIGLQNGCRSYIAFISAQPITNAKINLGSYLDYLMEHGYMQSDLWLNSIEFGTEIMRGQGDIVISEYSIEIGKVVHKPKLAK